MLEFNNVFKTFRLDQKQRITAVQGLSLHVAKGHVFGCIGPNGAGKSTTIKLLLNLIHPDSGSICINGISSFQDASRNMVGYLPENPYIYDFLTAHEYLRYSGSISGMTSTQIKSRSDELLTKLKLNRSANRRISGFSKGMQQRVAIAAALIHDPDLVILDEPMSGLDPLGRKLIFDLISELKQQGKTVFISSHVLTDIERLCDRVGIIAQGRLCFVGSVVDMTMSLDDLFLHVVEQAGMDEVR